MNYTIEPVPPICPQCGTEMVLRTKGTDKFYGCPNYRECGAKTISYRESKKEKPEVRRPEQPTRDLVLIETLDAINTRLDAIEKGFADKMANLKKILILIEKKIDNNKSI